MQYLTKNNQNRQIYQSHFVNVKVYSMNCKVFLGCLLFQSIEFLGLIVLKLWILWFKCLCMQNIRHLERETVQKFGDIFRMGNILEMNALKNDIGLMAKTYFFVIPDTRNTR